MGRTLSAKEIEAITNSFYSNFTGVNPLEVSKGIHFVRSEARDQKVKGFGRKYTVYILVKEDVCIVSYAPQYTRFLNALNGCGVDEILSAVSSAYRLKEMQLMIFRGERVSEFGNARILKKSDYPLYKEFFRKANPAADPEGWLEDYFTEKAAKEYFAGYLLNGALVSVCDAPDMPYMENVIQHTGIETLQAERGKGYAKCTSALAAHHLLERGICPQWECRADNTASIALAQSIGYEKYGKAYILEE